MSEERLQCENADSQERHRHGTELVGPTQTVTVKERGKDQRLAEVDGQAHPTRRFQR